MRKSKDQIQFFISWEKHEIVKKVLKNYFEMEDFVSMKFQAFEMYVIHIVTVGYKVRSRVSSLFGCNMSERHISYLFHQK